MKFLVSLAISLNLFLTCAFVAYGQQRAPQLMWGDRPVTVMCGEDMEHAQEVLGSIMLAMRIQAPPDCPQGGSECIAESFLYYHAQSLAKALRELERLQCVEA